MSFEFPLGLLGLIGVPIIILIYILKNKHTEQIVPSTYLWELSERFLEKKKKVNLVSGIISLILQIIAIISISLAIAHPILTIPNAAKEYCFILDASGSMNMQSSENVARIDLGKKEIEAIIDDASDGSKFTLIHAGATTRLIYEKLDDKDKAIELLSGLEATGLTVNYDSTLKYVQDYFNVNSSLITYLVTDKDYNATNIEIINVSNNEDNYAVVNTEYKIEDSILTVYGNVISYENDALLSIEIYVNDTLISSQQISSVKLALSEYSAQCDITDFDTIKVVITNSDGLSDDNTNIIYNINNVYNHKTLIVSEYPFYLKSAIDTVGNTEVYVVSPTYYNSNMTGYSLYIFDSFTPNILPNDGTIWLFGLEKSLDGTGFSIQDVIEDEENGLEISYAKNSTAIYKELTKGLAKETIYISKYVKYGLYRNFTTIATCDGNPVIFAGSTDSGCREVVFAFDLHDSSLPLLMDYLILINNFLNYSFPVVIEETSYICGDTIALNVTSDCDSIRVESPKGNVSYLDVSSEITYLETSEVGTYTLTMMCGDEIKVFKIYVGMPEDESAPALMSTEISLAGVQENDYSDGIYDKLIILFILLAVVYVADWMVYCYEQYQLR